MSCRNPSRHIAGLVNAIGGIDVTVPASTKGFGYTFVKGVNHLTGVTAIYYGRDQTIKGQDRVLRQENLMRAVMTKIANGHLLVNPVTMVHVLNAITSMLAVDSNFTNSDIESLVRQFGKLTADAATSSSGSRFGRAGTSSRDTATLPAQPGQRGGVPVRLEVPALPQEPPEERDRPGVHVGVQPAFGRPGPAGLRGT